ncbi:hypothetical protein ONZ45_g5210 [Pleurotus djamor]|nr:hypothetical protein ONZ45_g18074 [Pleurotus djamor]KAJ8517634.1 hypothetical protein ONZ45_g5210 [Pleurotus djamor]
MIIEPPPPRTTSPEPEVESEDPPDYNTSTTRHSRPPQFTNWLSDSLLLVPPRNASTSNVNPLYHISVKLNLNPFLPVSYITTVRRGADDQGPLVGSFEMSLSQRRATVSIGDIMTGLSKVLQTINSSPRHWSWNFGDVRLRWDCRNVLDDGSPMCICYARDDVSTQLASFVPPPLNASPPLPAATLTVFPEGHDCFDHILISALIVDRKRTLEY